MNKYIDAEALMNDLLKSTPIDWYNYTVDVQEVRHGRWERVGDVTYRCSVCGEIACCNSRFCGDCGAKMDEVEE